MFDTAHQMESFECGDVLTSHLVKSNVNNPMLRLDDLLI